MKDAYSLDRDPEGLQRSYDAQAGAYRRIFDRLGLQYYEVESDVGMMGGSAAMEYMAPSPAGEDRIALSEDGSYAANVEMAVSRPSLPDFGPSEPIHEIETPGITTIEQLSEFVGRDPRLTAKSVIVVPEDDQGGVVLALVRGDHRAHDLKLARAIGAPFRPATPEEIREAFGAEPGSIGAVGVRFADADLIGVPLRVTIGKRLEKDGVVSIKQRGMGDEVDVPAADAFSDLLERYHAVLA